MQPSEVIWKEYVDKIEVKHGVSTGKVEEVIFSKPHIRRVRSRRALGTRSITVAFLPSRNLAIA